jgi:hypothetical protein
MPDEQKIETHEGNAGEPQEQPPTTRAPAEQLPDSVFDDRQRRIGERRKEGGPPLPASRGIPAEDELLEDVPETVPDETPEGGGE